MNIISNNCIGATCYKLMGVEFNNPFMWSLVSPSDFIFLINNFDKINFKKIEKLTKNKIKVDGAIDVLFPHYKSGDFDTPTVIGSDVFYKDISSYTIDKWNTRLKKMLESGESPTFVISDRINGMENNRYQFDNQKLLANIHTKYRVIFMGVSEPSSHENLDFIQTMNRNGTVGGMASLLSKEL